MKTDFSLTTKYVDANPRKCRGCFGCRGIMACPKNAIGKVGSFWRRHSAFIDPGSCIGCMKCVKACRQNVFTKTVELEARQSNVEQLQIV